MAAPRTLAVGLSKAYAEAYQFPRVVVDGVETGLLEFQYLLGQPPPPTRRRGPPMPVKRPRWIDACRPLLAGKCPIATSKRCTQEWRGISHRVPSALGCPDRATMTKGANIGRHVLREADAQPPRRRTVTSNLEDAVTTTTLPRLVLSCLVEAALTQCCSPNAYVGGTTMTQTRPRHEHSAEKGGSRLVTNCHPPPNNRGSVTLIIRRGASDGTLRTRYMCSIHRTDQRFHSAPKHGNNWEAVKTTYLYVDVLRKRQLAQALEGSEQANGRNNTVCAGEMPGVGRKSTVALGEQAHRPS
ncbi:hypothetical protein RJ55_02773 [Drechmeria coniospora]|nr:hypothetical protein RJ55_02773 [Drechmeria coniospora]